MIVGTQGEPLLPPRQSYDRPCDSASVLKVRTKVRRKTNSDDEDAIELTCAPGDVSLGPNV